MSEVPRPPDLLPKVEGLYDERFGDADEVEQIAGTMCVNCGELGPDDDHEDDCLITLLEAE